MQNRKAQQLALALLAVAILGIGVAMIMRGRSDIDRAAPIVVLDSQGNPTRVGKSRDGKAAPGVELDQQGSARSGNDATIPRDADGNPLPLGTESGDEATSGVLAGHGRNGPGPGGSGVDVAGLGPDGLPLNGSNPRGGVGPRGGNIDPATGLPRTDGVNDDNPSGDDNTGGDGEGGVSGRVVRGEEPFLGAVIVLGGGPSGYQLQTTTDDAGLFRFEQLAAGTYTVSLLQPAAPNAYRSVNLREDGSWAEVDFVVPPAEPLQGRIVREGSGAAVEGALVDALQNGKSLGSLYSGADGSFTLFPLQAGTYNLKVTATGYEAGEKNFTIPESGTPISVEVALKPGQRIAGTVYSPSGSPQPQANTTLIGQALWNDPYQNSEWVLTKGDGTFEFGTPTAGVTAPFRVIAHKEGFLPAFSVPQDPANMSGEIEVRLASGAVVSGRIVDTEGIPIPEADVAVSGGFAETKVIFQRFNLKLPNAVTAEPGTFELRGVEPGSIELTVSAEGFVSEKFTFDIPAAGFQTGDLKLESSDEAKEGRVFGVVVDDRGTPLAGSNISIGRAGGGGAGFMTTDVKGGFKFDDLPSGDYVLTIGSSMLRGDLWIPANYTYPFARAGGEKVYVIYDLSQALDIRVVDQSGNPHKEFTVGVRVDDTGAAGAGGTREQIGMQYSRRFTTSTGSVRVDNLISGIATLSVSVPDIGTKEVPDVVVPPGGVGQLGDIMVGSGASVEGFCVRAESGQPLAGVEVRAVAPAGSPANHPLSTLDFKTWSDASGIFRMTGLPAGAAVLKLQAQGRTTQSIDVSFAAQQTYQAGEIRMEQGAILAGTVKDGAGNGLDNVILRVAGQTLFVDGQGRYRGDFFSTGTFDVRVNDQLNRYPARVISVSLEGGKETVLDVVMTN